MTESNDSALKQFIVTHTKRTFDEKQTGILLSQIGTLIAKEPPQLRNSLGSKKLADFISEEMADTIQIISPPEDSKLKVALPVSVPVSGNISGFIPKRIASNDTNDIPRYNIAFWAAFSQPLTNGYTRLIKFEPEIHFEDVKNPESATHTSKTISPDFIINQTDATNSSPGVLSLQISNNIRKWLLENGVAFDLVKAQYVDSKASGSGKESLLEILMSVLEESELKRIQIPLDIVAKLHRKR